MPEEPSFSFESRLSRSKGRTGRDRVVSARATAEEHQELEAAAKAEGKALSEWSRDVLLHHARTPCTDALFTEIVATRMLLNLVLKPLACGELVTAKEFSEVLTHVRTAKHQAAAEVMDQYSNSKK